MSADVWWKNGVIYQIYPRSFQDSNGDGVGDLRGIARRLDHLTRLGVDAVWISPIYPSPMADFGYDISDYCDVDPDFGTLADFDALVADAHACGLKVILDYVPNHTSDEHPWFLESLSSKDNPKRDWYLWRDPVPGGGPPNNWLSNFGGPSWTLDEATGQYWCHSFLPEQPDLNWRNPAVRAAMYDVLRFWLARGVDGFRVDVLYHLIKDEAWRDNPPNPDWHAGQESARRLLRTHTIDQPEMMQIVREMRGVVDAFSTSESERVLIGELYLPIDKLMKYYGATAAGALEGVQLPFNFHLIGVPWQARAIERLIRDYEAALPSGAAPNWVLGNHDKSRIASRVGPDGARLAALLLLTLRGTPTLYYGDEIGMTDAMIPPGEVQDPFERNEPGKGLGRDPERTPMQWRGDAPHAGFSDGTPWLRLADDWQSRNVAAQAGEPSSMLALYQRLLALRRREAALHAGRWEPIDGAPDDLLAYARSDGARRLVVLLNFGSAAIDVAALGLVPDHAEVLLSIRPDRGAGVAGPLVLQPLGGVVLAPAR